jgi:spore germination protein YaaH
VLQDEDEAGKLVPMRIDASIKAPIVADIPAGEKLMIWSEHKGWYRVQRENGYIGYMDKQDLAIDHVETVQGLEPKQAFIPWKPLGGKINLTWEQVVQKTPKMTNVGPMPGVNVVSPTWFHLLDGEGRLTNNADPAYVRWAHERGYQVWALFSNGFDPQRTAAALSSYDKRMSIIKQLLSFAQMYQLQGINIDFENVYLADRDKLTQFVREMVPLLHEQGLVVSIDVTTKSNSETWSMFYDRRALAEVVDYMMVMTYDEHWAASPVAGSVASLPWVERGIVRIMEEDGVPASKLVLGIPFYTRIWTEQWQDGKLKVSSQAVVMEKVKQIMATQKLTPVFSQEAGQHYVEYQENEQTKKIWIEDEVSIRARVELVKKYDLAGVAAWRRGYETPDIWTVIKESLEKRP